MISIDLKRAKEVADLLDFGSDECEYEAASIIRSLCEIVSKLPLTEDKIPFVYGTLYVNGFSGGLPTIFEYPAHIRPLGTSGMYIAHVWGERLERGHSTRESALAAAGKEKA